MMAYYYVLDEHRRPVRVDDVLMWARWFGIDENRRVGLDEIDSSITVSTVFLGIDHNFGGRGAVLLFETMVFRDGDQVGQWRYSTWDDARAGHDSVVSEINKAILVRATARGALSVSEINKAILEAMGWEP